MGIQANRPSVGQLQPSLIRELANGALGRDDVLALWFGEPDVPTSQFIRDVAKVALDDGATFYQANAGHPQLRSALKDYMNGLYGTAFDVDNIIVTSSGMSAVALATQCIVAEGDHVVTHSPTWPNLPSTPQIMGADLTCVPLRPKDGYWHLDIEALLGACTSKTRALLINSPSNPTGWMLNDDEQEYILEFCRANDIWLIADEVYSRIVYDRDYAPSFADKITDDDKVLIVNSFSKTWAMTGWRLGWLTIPKSMLTTFEMLVEYNFACVFAPIQLAGVVAINEGEPFIKQSVARYQAALTYVTDQLDELPRVSFPKPRAAFYAFFGVDGVEDSFAFAQEILEKTGVGLAPGIAFGSDGEGYLRLCFASDVERLEQAFDRLKPMLT
jgi:aspartate/methionine/tyrosine aminotransferase